MQGLIQKKPTYFNIKITSDLFQMKTKRDIYMQCAFQPGLHTKQTGLGEQDLVHNTVAPLLAFCTAQH